MFKTTKLSQTLPQLFLTILLLIFSITTSAQTDLVRWNNDNYTPTLVSSNIGASNVTNTGGVNINNQTWDVGFYETGAGSTWPSGAIDLSKFIEFTISANMGYQINLSNFNFYYRAGWNSPNFQVRYSKDNFATYYTSIGNSTVPGSWTNGSGSLASVNPVLPGQTVKIRIYVYNTSGATFHIRRTDSSFAPKITGTVSAASPPVAVNDNASTAQNIPVAVNILGNDTHSTLNSINITQQPANGQNIAVNGVTNVTYTPNTNYTGADSFKYTITDGNGTSNEATVSVNVIPAVAPTAVADAATITVNQVTNINVLANDTPGSGAFDDVTIITNATNGTAVVNPNNTIAYTPNLNYTGPDSFQYNVTNIHNMTSNTVTVTLNVYSPTGLVRWNGAGNSLNPTLLVSNITASPITNQGGGSITINNWGGDENFQTGSWPTPSQNGGYLNEDRYVQFTIAPNPNYKIDLNQFNFEVMMDGGSANFEVRYSKDFSQGYSSFNGTISGSWTTKSGSLSAVSPVMPGETVYIRLFVYNTHNSVRIRQSAGGSLGPTITGAVSTAITDQPTDLGLTLSMNPDEPNTGDNVVFTLEVENHGPNDATGVNVVDQLPVGFSYISDTSGGSYNSGTGTWAVGNLANGATITLEITAQKQATGPYTNTATVSHNGSDGNSSNDSGSVTPSNACADCTNTIPSGGGHIEVLAGQVFCLHSGTFTGTFNIQAGGTICIGENANFSPTGPADPSDFSGTIINRGTMTFPLYSDDGPHTGTILNYGVYNTLQIQGFAGTIENYGTIANSGGTNFLPDASVINEGSYTAVSFQSFDGTLTNSGTFNITNNATFLEGASIVNQGDMLMNNVDFNDVTVTNYNSFEVNAGFDFLGENGYFDNKSGATVILNPTSGSTEITSPFDNEGTAQIYRANSGGGISTVVNNYGTMQIYQNIIFGLNTYLTNDGILEFHGASSVEFQGPLLQNNNLLTIFDGGNLSLNSPISQMVNNKKVVVGGTVSHNVAGSNIVNNCTILSEDYFVGNGTSENNGLIWVNDYFELEGTLSILINSTTGFIRGADFRNSGEVSGYGEFYFTGDTNFESAGTFIGDDANSPIKFFDASPTGNQIFDEFVEDNPAINTIRPDSMTPYDDNTYDCTAPPTTAGYPPETDEVQINFCNPVSLTFDIDDYTEPHEPVNGNNFTILHTSIRLFDPNNQSNPTNNTTNLFIPGKGSLSVNTTNGVITFTPNIGFTSGSLEAQYRISNKWDGNPPVMPSSRTAITITLNELPDLVIEDGENPVCIGQTITFSIESPDEVISGVWESSDPSIATVDNDGLVTGISTGTATISYIATFPSYPEGETCQIESVEEIEVYNCACYKNPNTEESDEFTHTGISTQVSQIRGWPESIPNGFIALDSKEKGLVITRVANETEIVEPIEGMLIYDIAASCVKLYNGIAWHCIQKNCD